MGEKVDTKGWLKLPVRAGIGVQTNRVKGSFGHSTDKFISTVYTLPISIWTYRELLKNMILKDLKIRYGGSLLGVAWSLLHPLAMILVYSVALKYILRIQLENYTLFLITGILPWIFFSSSANASTSAIISDANLVKKIRFPREILPLATVLFNLVQFLMALAVFFPALIFLQAELGWTLLAYPAVVLVHAAFTLGVALLLSAVTVFYQDIKHLTEVGLMILFWLTPVVYHLSMVPERVQWLFKLNPLAVYIACYQDIIYWGRWPTWDSWVVGVLWVAASLALGMWVFRRYDPRFAEEL